MPMVAMQCRNARCSHARCVEITAARSLVCVAGELERVSGAARPHLIHVRLRAGVEPVHHEDLDGCAGLDDCFTSGLRPSIMRPLVSNLMASPVKLQRPAAMSRANLSILAHFLFRFGAWPARNSAAIAGVRLMTSNVGMDMMRYPSVSC